MKQAIHPAYGLVVFCDPSADTSFLTRSSIVGRLGEGHPRVVWGDGVAYPVVDVDVSKASTFRWCARCRQVNAPEDLVDDVCHACFPGVF